MSVGDRDAYYHEDRRMIDDVEKFIRANSIVITRYDVPFGAGYAEKLKDGKMVIYMDRRVPETVRIGRKDVNLFRYWLLHEWVEKSLETPVDMTYFFRHQIAERTEESAVASDGINDKLYDACCDSILNEIYKLGEWRDCPPDLDLTPYTNTQDPCLKNMWANGKKLG